MGYLTTVTFRNDSWGNIRNNPKEVIDKIYDAMASDNTQELGIGPDCNCIKVQKTRHASDFTVYAHAGNSVFEINPYSKDFKELMHRNTDFVKEILKEMQFYIDKCNEITDETASEVITNLPTAF